MWVLRLILLLFSFTLLACSGTAVSMQGKGFEEFPAVAGDGFDNVVLSYKLKWARCSEEIRSQLTRSRFGNEELLCSDGYVLAAVERNMGYVSSEMFQTSSDDEYKLLEDGLESLLALENNALVSAGFEPADDRMHTKKVGKTVYYMQVGRELVSRRQIYLYTIEKTDAEVAFASKWSDSRERMLFSKAARTFAFSDGRSFSSENIGKGEDMEAVLADLAEDGFIDDPSMLNDIKQGAFVGSLRFSSRQDTMELDIFNLELMDKAYKGF